MNLNLTQGALGLVEARSEFRKAHAHGRMRDLVSRLLRRCERLYSLVEAAAGSACAVGSRAAPTPRALTPGRTRLEDVPLARIVGSLDRAGDYTAGFLPLLSSDEERWARVRVAADSLEGLPPVELYELDGDYYVKDGHHRVSVMKRMGLKTVEAYVTALKVW